MKQEKQFFEDYTKQYDMTIRQIVRKYYHSNRVENYANYIARKLRLTKEQINTASICGLFHDLGRFPQYSEYQTFIDSESFDHGNKSREILLENNYDNKTVLKAVKNHNKYRLPDNLTEEEELQCQILRDADKLDILRDDWMVQKRNNKIKEDIIWCFENQELVPNYMVTDDVEGLLRQLSFIFDINYNVSRELLYKSNDIKRNIDLIRKYCNDEQLYYIEDLLEDYLSKELGVKKYERIR